MINPFKRIKELEDEVDIIKHRLSRLNERLEKLEKPPKFNIGDVVDCMHYENSYKGAIVIGFSLRDESFYIPKYWMYKLLLGSRIVECSEGFLIKHQ